MGASLLALTKSIYYFMGNVSFSFFLVNIKCHLRTKSNHFP